MYKVIESNGMWNNSSIGFQSGVIARQSDSSVIAYHGNTKVLCSIMVEKNPESDCGFLPLTVNFFSRSYAFGRIPGGFFKREGKQSEHEILISRVIDRSIRPLFDSSIRNQIHVTCMLLSHDSSLPIDPVCVAGVSTACAILFSNKDFKGNVASVNMMCNLENKWILNSKSQDLKSNVADITISGTKDSISMVEMSANEISRDSITEALEIGYQSIQEILKISEEFIKKHRSENSDFYPSKLTYKKELSEKLQTLLNSKLDDQYFSIYKIAEKKLLSKEQELAHNRIVNDILSIDPESDKNSIQVSIESNIKKKFRDITFSSGKRIDNRNYGEIREISILNEPLSMPHGSVLFTRGNTQALVTTTLGTNQDEQLIDLLDGESEKRERFMLHYNFHPFSVGEAAQVKNSPGRREVGHGRLAAKAIGRCVPSKEDFPYSIRVVSEIMESDGSSSMATVCGASLSMMDAGIPLERHMAGIAMGMVYKNDDEYVILSDISGTEDGFGDMDLKVAGTSAGITALQMDIKVPGLNFQLITKAISQAEDGLEHILSKMDSAISVHRKDRKSSAPFISTITIDKNKIKDVIGTGGKNIREICEVSGAKIDVEQSGNIQISSPNQSGAEIAKRMIENIVLDPVLGNNYECTITKITNSGLCVSFMGGRQGFLYAEDVDQQAIESEIEVGISFEAKLISSNNDRHKLSMKKQGPVNKPEKNEERIDRQDQSSDVKSDKGYRGTRQDKRRLSPNMDKDDYKDQKSKDTGKRDDLPVDNIKVKKPTLGHAYRRRAMSNIYPEDLVNKGEENI